MHEMIANNELQWMWFCLKLSSRYYLLICLKKHRNHKKIKSGQLVFRSKTCGLLNITVKLCINKSTFSTLWSLENIMLDMWQSQTHILHSWSCIFWWEWKWIYLIKEWVYVALSAKNEIFFLLHHRKTACYHIVSVVGRC